MEKERAKRLVVASVASAVVFFAVLMVISVYQMICLKKLNEEYANLCKEEQKLEEEREQLEDGIDLWLQEWKVEETARKYGYKKKK